ncbi:MAG: hypothetical protein K8S23_14215, partial [Candidatus Cloacimonetes bacterium]|nr:hypothetical protein [Candidatus Cloacimonadota bacterium]
MKTIRDNTIWDLVNNKTKPTASTDRDISFTKSVFPKPEWNEIQNKPTEFPPENHTHSEYSENSFEYENKEYELHDVAIQIVNFLGIELNFQLS